MSQNQKFKGTIKDQMRKQAPALLRSTARPTGIMLHPSSWKGDGEDHINVSSSARTTIGQWLHGRNSNPFNHPLLGHFRSIDNLSFFIRSVNIDDRVRTMENFNMIRQLVEENGGFRASTPNFKAIMVHSIWLRILDNPTLIKEIVESTLPFDSYRINSETKVRQRFEPAAYLCRGYEEIRKALVERRDPNLVQFLDKKPSDSRDVDIYLDIMQILTGGHYGMNAGEIVSKYAAMCWEKYDQYVVNAAEDAERRAAKKRLQRKAAKDRKRAALAREKAEQLGVAVEVDGAVSIAGDEEMRVAQVAIGDNACSVYVRTGSDECGSTMTNGDNGSPAAEKVEQQGLTAMYEAWEQSITVPLTSSSITGDEGVQLAQGAESKPDAAETVTSYECRIQYPNMATPAAAEVPVTGVNVNHTEENSGVVEAEICANTEMEVPQYEPGVEEVPVVDAANAALSNMDDSVSAV